MTRAADMSTKAVSPESTFAGVSAKAHKGLTISIRNIRRITAQRLLAPITNLQGLICGYGEK
jgi:hypothetical protein